MKNYFCVYCTSIEMSFTLCSLNELEHSLGIPTVMHVSTCSVELYTMFLDFYNLYVTCIAQTMILNDTKSSTSTEIYTSIL